MPGVALVVHRPEQQPGFGAHPRSTVLDVHVRRATEHRRVAARRYTEHQFRRAVADPEVRTMADLCRALGLVPRGANYEGVRALGEQLLVDVDEVLTLRRLGVSAERVVRESGDSPSMGELLRRLELKNHSSTRRILGGVLRRRGLKVPDASPLAHDEYGRRRPRSYTDEDLIEALGHARNYPELCRALDLSPVSGTYRRLRARARELGRPIPSDWSRPGRLGADGVPRRRSDRTRPNQLNHSIEYPEEALRVSLSTATSLADAIRALGDGPTAVTYARLKRGIERYGLDIGHLERPRRGTARRPLKDLLVEGVRAKGSVLRQRLVEEGLRDHRCERCDRTHWGGVAIPLELDHINGDRTDNRPANLRLLCPNCHALTPTYRGRNIGRRWKAGA